jgi:adenylate kinase
MATIARNIATEEVGKDRILTDAHFKIRFDRGYFKASPRISGYPSPWQMLCA